MTYAGSEQSVQGGAPLELYRFAVGGTPAIPSGGDNTVVLFQDGFEAGVGAWTLQPGDFAQYSSCVPIDSCTHGVCSPLRTGYALKDFGGVTTTTASGYGGGTAIALLVPPSAVCVPTTQPGHAGAYYYHDVTGLTPGVTYTVTCKCQLVAGFLDDPDYFPSRYQVGLQQPGGGEVSATKTGAWQTLTMHDVPRFNSGTTLRIGIGWIFLSYYTVNGHTALAFDNVALLGPGTPTPGVAAVDPTYANYTSADVPVVYNAETYAPAIIIRSPFQTGKDETSGSELEISIPRDHTLATTAGGGPPRLPVSLQVIRLHRSDLTAAITPWRGQVIGSRFEGPRCVLRCASVRALLDRKVPRYLTQKACGHFLYDGLCQASRVLNTRGPFNVSAISGRVVTVDGSATAAAGRVTGWPGGIFVAPNGAQVGIESVNGDALTLKMAIPSLAVSSAVTLVFGCNKKVESCSTDFGNERHFGGEPVMPIRNPGTGAGIVGDGGAG